MDYVTLAFKVLHIFFAVLAAGMTYAMLAAQRNSTVPQLTSHRTPLIRLSYVLMWVFGFALIGLVYHKGGLLPREVGQSGGKAAGITTVLLFGGYFVYDFFSRRVLKNAALAVVMGGLVGAAAYGLLLVTSPRSAFLHLGATIGTAMMMNFHLRIRPLERKIEGSDSSELRAEWYRRVKQSAAMLGPALLFMLSPQVPELTSSELAPLWAVAIYAAGLVLSAPFLPKSKV